MPQLAERDPNIDEGAEYSGGATGQNGSNRSAGSLASRAAEGIGNSLSGGKSKGKSSGVSSGKGGGVKTSPFDDKHKSISKGGGKPKLAEGLPGKVGSMSGGGKSAALDKVADKIPGGKPQAEKGMAEKGLDKAAGKAVSAVATPVAGEVVEKVGVRRISKLMLLNIAFLLTPLIFLCLIFFYVATHPWSAVKKVLTDSGLRRFALSAAKEASGFKKGGSAMAPGAKSTLSALSFEVNYRPGVAIAASGQKPEPGTFLDLLSKIDMEKSRNKYKPSYCQYKVITKRVTSFDGSIRSVLDKVVDEKGAEADASDPIVFACVLEQYPVMEAMMRSPEARKINQQAKIHLSYAESKDSGTLKGGDAKVKEALHKKTLERVWRNDGDNQTTDCVDNYKATARLKIDRAIAEVANDLKCGQKPEDIKVDYKVSEVPNNVDPNSPEGKKKLVYYTQTACSFYEKLNQDKSAVKKYELNRAQSSARAGFQALTLADTGLGGDISTPELNNDFYKAANFSSSRAYNQEVNGLDSGTQADPESIPTRLIGLERNYLDTLAMQTPAIKDSLDKLCKAQDKAGNFDVFSSFSSLFSGLFGFGGGNHKTEAEYAADINVTLDYLKARISQESPEVFPTRDDVTLNDIIVRTIKITSNISNAGTEDGPDNFNRMTLGVKNSMYVMSIGLLGGHYQDADEAAKDSVAVETIKRNRDAQNGIAYRLLNTDNPRSVVSRLAAEGTATPKQVVDKTTRYAINLLNPVRAFAELNSAVAYVGYGETNRAIAATDDDRSYWKIDTAGTTAGGDSISNAAFIEALKKQLSNPAYANNPTIMAVNADITAWDTCMTTYYPDMQAVDDSGIKPCQIMRHTKESKNIASAYSISGVDEKTLADKYAKYKGDMNLYGAWAKLSSDAQDDSIYASSDLGGAIGGAVGTGSQPTGTGPNGSVRVDKAVSCTGGPQAGTVALSQYIMSKFQTGDDGIYNCRSVRGGSSLSLHGEGRAFDAKLSAADPAEKSRGDALFQWAITNAANIGAQEVIWNHQIWSPTQGIHPYSGVNPHTDHVHIGQNWDGAKSLTAFYTSGAGK